MIIPDEHVTTREVACWKGLHLLHFQSSSCSQKVRVLLREKGLDWESHPIDLPAQKHVSAWYLGINPRGVVPVLVHDGVVHVESNDIMEHLDALPSDAEPFFPQTEAERAWVKENLELENSLHMDLRNLTMGFIMPRRFAQKSAKTLERWEREGREDPKRALEVQWWRDYAERGIPAETAQASVDAHRSVFEMLDERLATSAWLIGERLSVLDVAWFITTRRLHLAGYPLERHARLARWHERLTQRPAFAEETSDPALLRIVLPIYAGFRRLERTSLTDVTS
jgi:glutathione S-transferase